MTTIGYLLYENVRQHRAYRLCRVIYWRLTRKLIAVLEKVRQHRAYRSCRVIYWRLKRKPIAVLSHTFTHLPNWLKVLCAVPFSALLFGIFFCIFKSTESITSPAFWTFLTVITSSPIAFIIWHFRDQNATQQIENQRKDINLKEFQKLAEWVSGLHLIEDEVTEKTVQHKTDKEEAQSEKTFKYMYPHAEQSIPTFRKRDGAVGLQIAAIHGLLPFFRGEYGESFRRPALNLLTSAWLSLQQRELLVLNDIEPEKADDFHAQIQKIQTRAKSPVGVALTQVLLSDGGENLLQFPEVFPNLCLAGMDFHLPGLDQQVLSIFIRKGQDCSGIILTGCNLNKAKLERAKLEWAKLDRAELNEAKLNGAKLNEAQLNRAELNGAQLNGVELNLAKLNLAGLNGAELNGAELNGAELNGAELRWVELNGAKLNGAELNGAELNGAELNGAIIVLYDDTDGEEKELKALGAVIVYCNIRKWTRATLSIQHKTKGSQYHHVIFHLLDLEKTRQANPDWDITVEEQEF